MQIELHYRPAVGGENRFGNRIQRRKFEVPDQADISSILPQIHGSALARWVDDKYDGHVEGNYVSSGALEANVTYHICSNNIPETIRALDKLKELKF